MSTLDESPIFTQIAESRFDTPQWPVREDVFQGLDTIAEQPWSEDVETAEQLDGEWNVEWNEDNFAPSWAPDLEEEEKEEVGSQQFPSSRLEWPGKSAEELTFMRDVYDLQMAKSSKSGSFTADLPNAVPIKGEGSHRAQPDAAEAVRALLQSARQQLAAEGLDDRVQIGIVSAYRPATEQFKIWQGKGRSGGFPYYYREMLEQGRIHRGDFGADAVEKMAARMSQVIASPGYSNHQDGLAFDLGIGDRRKGGLGKIGTRAWLHKWLIKKESPDGPTNARRFGFQPLATEPWHWTFRGKVSSEASSDETATNTISASELEVAKVPLLSAHRGAGPDLILGWNDMSTMPEVIDVVVHLHGYWYPKRRLLDAIKPVSGLNLAPKDTAQRRSRPTLTILPRGHDTGVTQKWKQKDGTYKYGYNKFTFPRIVSKDGLDDLIRFALDHFAKKVGGTPPRIGRLILTAHSGGGAALLKILEHTDPHQVHVFDALYQDARTLSKWAHRRIERDREALQAPGTPGAEDYMRTQGGALRVFYQGKVRGGTRPYSLALHKEILPRLGSGLERWYRVEASTYDHFAIPRNYGWRMLIDASADAPEAQTEPDEERRRELEAEEESADPEEAECANEFGADTDTDEYASSFEELDELWEKGDDNEADYEEGYQEIEESEAESQTTVTFPSGAKLRVVNAPVSPGEEHYDPNGSGNPVLDTGHDVRSTKLSANFNVDELARSGGRRFDKSRIDPALVACLQQLRDRIGKPMVINSGYRSYADNAKLYIETYKKKPTDSQHSSGRAADIRISGMSGMNIAKAALEVCGTNLGVGIAETYAHIDVRGKWARWTYFGNGSPKDRQAIAEIDAYRTKVLAGTPPTNTGKPVHASPPVVGATAGTPNIPLGTLELRTPDRTWSYRFTPEDLVWTAKLLVHEAGGADDANNAAVLWAMFNRYSLFTYKTFTTFSGFIRAYSTTLQPVLLNSQAAARHMNRPASEFVRTGGTYKGTEIPMGQLRRHLDIQQAPWSSVKRSARELATRALTGQLSNPGIGLASQFASTRVYFNQQHGRNPDAAEWRKYTTDLAARKKWRWVGDVDRLDQLKNAFFLDLRSAGLPADAVRVVPPATAGELSPEPEDWEFDETAPETQQDFDDEAGKAIEVIRAATSSWGTDEDAIRVALTSLSPPDVAEVAADAATIRILTDNLSAPDITLVSSLLARGRVGGMSRNDLATIIGAPARYNLGTLAAAYAREELLAHHDAFDRTGTGTIHGNQCGVPTPDGAKSSDCTMYALDVLKKAFSAKGQQAVWRDVIAEANDQSGGKLKGTEVLRALQTIAGWEAVFWAPDPRNPADRDAEHPDAFRKVREAGSYYRITVDRSRSVVNYRRTDPAAATDSTGIAHLRKLQFGALVARGGNHVALIVNDEVYEVHWANPATDRDAIEATPLERFAYLSGALAAPATDLRRAWQTP